MASKSSIPSDETFKSWSRGKCLYQCSVCEIFIHDSGHFVKHISSAHKMSKKMYLSSFSDPCTFEVKMTCKICDQLLRHDRRTMRKHMDEIHRLELEEYFKRFHSNETFKPAKVVFKTNYLYKYFKWN